jgi:hypothetical protein
LAGVAQVGSLELDCNSLFHIVQMAGVLLLFAELYMSPRGQTALR